MAYGLTASELEFLNHNLIKPLKMLDTKVYIFGSRATGKFKKFSDIDLLYVPSKHQSVSLSTLSKIIMSLEESDFPYKIDLVNADEIAASYKDNIEKDMIEL